MDVDARMAQIVGDPPRIEPLDQEGMTAEGLELVVRLNRSLGYEARIFTPEYFRTMIKHPDLFRCQLETGTMLFSGTLDMRDRELAVLRTAWMCRAPYQWGKHVALAKSCGITAAEIERVTEGSSAPGWSVHDAAILRGVEELMDDKMISDETWAILAATWSEAQLIEFPMLVGVYVTTAFTQNALRMRMTEENPGLHAR